MASAVASGPSQLPANVVPVKKRTRLNPARRRAAAKLKAAAEAERTSSDAPIVINGVSPLLQLQAKQKAIQTSVVKPRSAASIPLQRQNTEPLPDVRKPALTRAITAPPGSTGEQPKSTALSFSAPAIVTGGLVGCAAGAAILLGVGMWYDFSGAEQAILTAKAAKLCVDNLAEEIITSLKAGTYSADEALDMLRRTTLAYASTIPEGAPFVERMFREVDMVRKQRGREIDKVVAETYAELQKASSRGATGVEMRGIVFKQLVKLSHFASKATQDIVTRNPNLRPYRDEAAKAMKGPPEARMPTVRVNMAVRQR